MVARPLQAPSDGPVAPAAPHVVASDTVEYVLEGAEPDGLSLEKLYRVPVMWEGQKSVLSVREHGYLPTRQRRVYNAVLRGRSDLPEYHIPHCGECGREDPPGQSHLNGVEEKFT
jgi:hypothetical protein